jgi:GxxExxY protein
MIKPDENYIHSDLTEKIIGCAYDVYNQLGFGFLEKVYENAMMIKLPQQGLKAVQQAPISVYFEGKPVGEFFADILVNDQVILEFKAVSALTKAHEVQLVNYLKATGIKVDGLVRSPGRCHCERSEATSLFATD